MVNGVDDHRHRGLRKRLVQTLVAKGITEDKVLEAIGAIPRHLFIDDSAFLEMAYEDIAFPIGSGQTISQPYTVAFQTALLEVGPRMKVLEIGTGSGYQTAVLNHLGCKIFSIERHKPLYLRTKQRLAAMSIRPVLYHGDGYLGLPKEGPFDRILVTCGAPFIPSGLIDQLKPGGLMVIPVGEGEEQRMLRVERGLDGALRTVDKGAFRFVPMLQDRKG